MPRDCTDVPVCTLAEKLLCMALEGGVSDRQTGQQYLGEETKRDRRQAVLVEIYLFYNSCGFFETDLWYNQRNS